MKELLIIMANAVPIEGLVGQLEEALQNYKTDPSEKNLNMLHLGCVMICTKRTMDGKTLQESLQQVKEIDEALKFAERIKPTN